MALSGHRRELSTLQGQEIVLFPYCLPIILPLRVMPIMTGSGWLECSMLTGVLSVDFTNGEHEHIFDEIENESCPGFAWRIGPSIHYKGSLLLDIPITRSFRLCVFFCGLCILSAVTDTST